MRSVGPISWSVRREVWEHASIWLAPSVTAGAVLSLMVLILVVMTRPGAVPALPFVIAPSFVIMAMVLVSLYYCLDALHGERRDRSILFWKSLPVSDLATVLSKAAIPLLVLPLVTFVIAAALQLALWLAYEATGSIAGLPADAPGPYPLLQSWGLLLYDLAAMTLWLAPIDAWCLLVSAWARRAPLVWAALPVMILARLEEAALGTRHLSDRWVRWSTEAYLSSPREGLLFDPLNPIAPAKFLRSPGLWIGLALAAAFLFAAAGLRRRRSPL